MYIALNKFKIGSGKEKEFEEVFFSFETPYYKIRVGKYVSKIKAIKELKRLRKNNLLQLYYNPIKYLIFFFISNLELAPITFPILMSL